MDFSEFDAMIKTAVGRKRWIEYITVKHEDNWQDVATPYDIVGEMVDLVKEANGFVVFFSLEFLEVMVHERGIPAESILFVTDYDVEGALAKKMYGVDFVVCPKSSMIMDGKFDFSLAKSAIHVKMSEKEIGENMKFNKVAVIGNPPYQINDGGGKGSSAKPIYHLFVESVIDNICPDYFSFIIPSRWMVGGKGLDNHRERMMNDRRMKKIVHFGSESDVFSNVRIQGGVNYFLWIKNHDGLCDFMHGNTCHERYLNQYDIVLQDNNAVSILEKVKAKDFQGLDQKVFSQKPFGLRSDFKQFTQHGVMCYSKNGKHIIKSFCDEQVVQDKFNIMHKYKICISKTNDDSSPFPPYRITTEAAVFEPNSVSTETFLVLHACLNIKEANNFASYVHTKFFRFMVSLRKSTHNLSRDVFAWVPDVEDYSAPWTDKELYKKFGLTRQEIAYIESKIKAIN